MKISMNRQVMKVHLILNVLIFFKHELSSDNFFVCVDFHELCSTLVNDLSF